MSRVLCRRRNVGVVLALSLCLTFGLSAGALGTTVCDTDPEAVRYTPSVDPTLLNALIDTLGGIDVFTTSSTGISLLYSHTLHVTLDSFIDLAGTDFIVTPGFGSLEVELAIPGWGSDLSTSMSHAACRNCDAEYNSCASDCDDDYDDCCTYFGCELICGPIWVACEGICAGAYPICLADVGLCIAEREAIDFLLGGHSFGMSFSSASVTQTADVCVTGDCDVANPLETNVADLSGFLLHLFPTGDPLGIGAWLNGIISSLVNWVLNIESIIAGFFVTTQGEGVLILPFVADIASDGCLPVQEVIDCAGGGCSTVEEQAGSIGRGANLLFYGLPVLLLLGLLIWRKRR